MIKMMEHNMSDMNEELFDIHCIPRANCCTGLHSQGADHRGDQPIYPRYLFEVDAIRLAPSQTSQRYKREPLLTKENLSVQSMIAIKEHER